VTEENRYKIYAEGDVKEFKTDWSSSTVIEGSEIKAILACPKCANAVYSWHEGSKRELKEAVEETLKALAGGQKEWLKKQ